MPDPISLVALGAAVGGAAGKFVEKAWDSGEKWLSSYYAGHREKAQESARINSAEFLNNLAEKINLLEQNQKVARETIESAQDKPDFSVMLHKALIGAAQTDNKEKHQILARLVAERLKVGSESRLTLASQLACDVIPNITMTQIKLMGLLAFLSHIVPNEKATQDLNGFLEVRLKPFKDLKYDFMDVLHLESLSCLKHMSFIGRDLKTILKAKGVEEANFERFKDSEGSWLIRLWNGDKERFGLQTLDLTSIGVVIGIYSSDLLTCSRTEFTDL